MPCSTPLVLLLILNFAWVGLGNYGASERDKCEYLGNTHYDDYGRVVATLCQDTCGGKGLTTRCKMEVFIVGTIQNVQCYCKDSVTLATAGGNGIGCEDIGQYSKEKCFECYLDNRWGTPNAKGLRLPMRYSVCLEKEGENKTKGWSITPQTGKSQ